MNKYTKQAQQEWLQPKPKKRSPIWLISFLAFFYYLCQQIAYYYF